MKMLPKMEINDDLAAQLSTSPIVDRKNIIAKFHFRMNFVNF